MFFPPLEALSSPPSSHAMLFLPKTEGIIVKFNMKHTKSESDLWTAVFYFPLAATHPEKQKKI